MDYNDLKALAVRKERDARALTHMINQPTFKLLYLRAEPLEQLHVQKMVASCNLDVLRFWIKDQKLEQCDYTKMTVANLRKAAAERKIHGYQYLSKIELIIALEDNDDCCFTTEDC